MTQKLNLAGKEKFQKLSKSNISEDNPSQNILRPTNKIPIFQYSLVSTAEKSFFLAPVTSPPPSVNVVILKLVDGDK